MRPGGGIKALGSVGAGLAVLFVGSLAFNAASTQERWPGPLDLVRRYPWLILLLLAPVAVIGLWPSSRHGRSADQIVVDSFRLPARHPNFTGRSSALRRLRSALTSGGTASIHALHGMGGVGKTQTSIEYAYRYQDRYRFVAFIDAERAEILMSQFVAMAGELGLSGVQPDQAVGAVYRLLAQRGRWLLIFDNAEDPEDLLRFMPSGRATRTGHVIVTTRRAGWRAFGSSIDVDLFERAESIDLLVSRVPSLSEAHADRIAELLGDLPLALEQSAAYLERTATPPEEYVDLLTLRMDQMLGHGTVADRPGVVVGTLWELNLRQLQRVRPAAVRLLELCALLAPEPIPTDLFSRHPTLLDEPLRSACPDPVEWNTVVGDLVGLSLARRNGSRLVFHRLVQAAVRSGLTSDRRDATYRTLCDLLLAALPADVESGPSRWPGWQVNLPHVITVVGAARESAGVGELLNLAARYLRTIGDPDSALPLAERARAVTEALYGPNHAAVGSALMTLARIQRDQGQPTIALPLAQRALAIFETEPRRDNPELGGVLKVLGWVLNDLGRPAEARPFAERALAIDETTLGRSHPYVGGDLNILARVNRELGHHREAIEQADRGLRIYEAAYGKDHPYVGVVLTILARLHDDLGEPARGVPLAARAVHIHESAQGRNHPDVGCALTVLACLHCSLGQMTTARGLAQRALTILEARRGPDHRETVDARQALALADS
ncbi:FxSxx-COOH system tetratricopeptide repeat protein [Micromonospora sp. NPDC005203]|uniref:FxSxx-COOH system tetratricopeptide repeat protein n=1 Tax=Micromonospora sp. NPDC005203 TaxID=3364226 RepID=UPI0036BB2098